MSSIPPGPDVVVFGPFQLHIAQGRLFRDGVEIDLQPLVLELLRFGALRPGQLISRDTLRSELWPDVQVTDHSLTQLVFKLRSALGEHRGFWKTVPRRGFRFDAPTQVRAAPRSPPESLLGRDALLDSLVEWVGPGRVVTLVGPGGIGKTTLARALCQRSPRAWFVDLSTARTAADLCGAVASTVGVELARGQEAPEQRLRWALEALGEGMVVLDNLEQLHDAGQVMGAWAGLPLSWVCTSREALGVTGEQLVPVGPLSTEASVELLRRRVRHHDPLAADALSGRGVEQLVAALDGIPLALELAAPQLAVQSAEALAAALPGRLELLVSPGAARPPRHHTLLRSFELSWQTLAPWARLALVQLAAFRGDFTAERAEAVLDLPEEAPPVPRALAHLRRTSWIERRVHSEQVVLRLLLPIRAFVRRTEMGVEKGGRALRRHAEVVLAGLPDLDALVSPSAAVHAEMAPSRTELRAIVDRDLPSHQRALAALAAAGIAERHGMYEVGLETLEQGVDGRTDPDLQAAIWLLRSRILQKGVGAQAAKALAEKALAVAVAPSLAAYARVRLADIAMRRGDLDEADAKLAPVLTDIRVPERLRIQTALLAARVCRRRGLSSREQLEDVLSCGGGHPDLMIDIRAELAVVLRGTDLDRAIRLLEQAREGAAELGRRVVFTGLSLNLGSMLWQANRREEARGMLASSLDSARALGDRTLHGHAALSSANALADLGQSADAWPLYDEAHNALNEVSKPMAENVELCRAVTLFAVGDHPRAQAVLERVKEHSREMVDPPTGWRADLVLASVALVGGDIGACEAFADKALTAMEGYPEAAQRAEALAHRGLTRVWLGRREEGEADLEASRACVGGDRGRAWWCWRVFDALARGADVAPMGEVLERTQPDRWVRALHSWAAGRRSAQGDVP